MSDFVKFKLTGLNGLSEALRQLPRALGDSVLKKALTQSAGPVVDYARATAGFIDRSGSLRKSIGVRPMRRRRYGSEIAMGPNAPHAHLVEFGTAAHDITAKPGGILSWLGIRTKYVHHPGAKPKPFFRKAWDAKGGPAMLEDLGVRIWAELAKAADKLAKKGTAGKLSSRDMDALS